MAILSFVKHEEGTTIQPVFELSYAYESFEVSGLLPPPEY
jgi:hypothetical protein